MQVMGCISKVKIHLVNLCADIEKAYLQICILKSERECLTFHWVAATNNDRIEIYRFVRLVCGPTQSLSY